MPQEERSIHVHLALLFIVLLFGAVIVYARHVTNTRFENQNATVPPTKFTTYVYGINMEYPSDWQPTPGYNYNRYSGQGGFFELSAAGGQDTDLGTMARNEVEHKLKPYGSSPTTENITVDGDPGILITPSADQGKDMQGQAELILRYPKPVTISGQQYFYLVLWADKDHIRDIIRTIHFI